MTARIGIDLGTTNCVVAWVDPNTSMPQVLKDEAELPLLPSVLAQDRNGDILVGRRAKFLKEPLFRHAFVKREIGTTRRFPLKDGDYTAAEISAWFLRAMKKRAEQALKDEVAAVVTVPAHFEEIHLNETRQAAKEAGLELIDLIREPVAAALAYYSDASFRGEAGASSQILTFDLGGGTMDAALCLRQGSHIEVGAHGRAYDGDKFLGGLDFDKALLGLAVEQLARQDIRLDVVSLGDGISKTSWLWDLLLSAEKVKHELTENLEAHWSKEVTVGDQRGAVDFWVTRGQFEECIQNKIEQTLRHCDNALLAHAETRAHSEKLSIEDRLKRVVAELDMVILVGGSTRVPCIEREIRKHYKDISGIDMKIRSFRVDECVAVGAAIYAATRSTGSSIRDTGPAIQWIAGPSERVGQDVASHDELHGTVSDCSGPGWFIELSVGGKLWKIDLKPDGSFSFPGFSLQPGENRLALTVRDASSTVRGQQSHSVVRGGISVTPAGLARDIQVRLVDDMRPLLHKGSQPRSRQTETFYINDTSAVGRAPLYEGHHPIGLIEFPAGAKLGTPVEFRTGYRPGWLDIQVQVGDLPPQAREVEFQPLDVSSERSVLWERYQELSRSIDELLDQLPDEGHFTTILRKQFKALRLDIETDFESPVLDLARIDDRLRQLDQVGFHIRTFPNTVEGLKLRIESLRQHIVSLGDNCDAELLRELKELEQKIPPAGDPELMATLNGKFLGIKRRWRSCHPSPVTPENVAAMKQQMQHQIEDIQRSCKGDPQVLKTVVAIEESMGQILSSVEGNEALYNRLWELEFGYLSPLYHEMVIKQSQMGLLRSNA